jgi:hypothetical protein
LKGQIVGSGATGKILEKSVATRDFVAKVQKRGINRE